MANELEPIVGQWYMHRDKGEMFQVVAVDAGAEYIEIQSFDGDVEELDGSAWRDMDIETAAAPEDCTGPFDEVEPEDLGLTETAMSPQDWRQSLESLRTAEERWPDARPPDESDEERPTPPR